MTTRTPGRMSLGGSSLPTLTPRAKPYPTNTPARPPSSLSSHASSYSDNATLVQSPIEDQNTPLASVPQTARKPVARRPSTLTIRPAGASRPVTPSSARLSASTSTPRTPGSGSSRSRTPLGFGSASVSGRGSEMLAAGLEPGDQVRFDVGGLEMEGTLRFVGQVDGKAGDWGGVELEGEFAGQGKNDGTVKGEQYFACPPNCGLFIPLAKVRPKPSTFDPSTPSAAATARAKAGSAPLRRAGSSTSPSKSARPSLAPRRSLSPEKAAAMATPKARPRPSMGGATPSLPRKSLGGFGATPRQSVNSTKRPPSSLRSHAPDVPPIPPSFSSRSVTPVSGRATPSQPSAIQQAAQRRLSMASSLSRPATPSVRSVSRQSMASSVSRASSRSHAAEDDAVEELRAALEEAREKEVEMRLLLEGSERLGREMEDKLAAKEDELKAAAERVGLLEQDKERERQREQERLVAPDEEDKPMPNTEVAVAELEAKMAELTQAEATNKAAQVKLAREWDNKFAAKESELEALRDRSALAAEQANEEIADLNSQLESLRQAGQSLCETYDERIQEIELSRLETVDLAATLQKQLDSLQAGHLANGGERSGSPPSGGGALSNSLGASHASAAEAIDAENAQAELDHMRSRVNNLEEQLEETRMHLEAEMADTKRRKQKAAEAELALKKEIKMLKDSVSHSAEAEQRTAARIAELEDALIDSQAALEEERSELEGLRGEHVGGAAADVDGDELRRAHRELVKAQKEADQARCEAQQQAELVGELRADLRNADKELERKAAGGDTLGAMQRRESSTAGLVTLENGHSPSRRDSVASNGSRRRSIGPVKDEASTAKDSIVGFKLIISTLTDENAGLVAANKQLGEETKDLQDAHRALEVTVENLMNELSSAQPASPSADRRTSITPSLVALQREIDGLKTQLADAGRKADKQVEALHQEVSDLEAIVEAKVYKEEELEGIIDALKRNGPKGAAAGGTGSGLPFEDDGKCPMCHDEGHDLEDCPDFETSSPTKSSTSGAAGERSSSPGREWCDDCDEYGHSLEECPMANEVF